MVSYAENTVKPTLIERVKTGEDSKGGGFSDYGSYWLNKRTKKGLGSAKNFTFSGQMWDSFGVIGVKNNGKQITVSMSVDGDNIDSDGRKNKRSQKNIEILDGHTTRENKSLVALSEKEIDDLRISFKNELIRYFNDI